MLPLISVIIPVYKVEAYLTACVESVLAQTYQNIEIILVDDGSPDRCPELCDDLAVRDSRVRIIHKKNGGLSSARNAGIESAQGEYLAFLDSDDLWSPRFLECLLDSIQTVDADFAVCLFQRFREQPDTDSAIGSTPVELARDAAFSCLFDHRNENMVVAWNKLYRRTLFQTIRYPEGRIHEDEAIIHELIGASRRVAWLEEVHYFYRETPNSITNSRFSPKRLDAVWSKEQRIAWFEIQGMHELADQTRIAAMSMMMYLYRCALADRADRKTSSDCRRQLHECFCRMWTPELLRSRSVKARLRFRLFLHMPRLISEIDRFRLK